VSTISRILLVLFVVLILGGTMFLVTWDIPPPTAHIERVIPDDQLPR
jgi:Na+/H+ antiporter NhaC